jgi:spore germination protein YaaH
VEIVYTSFGEGKNRAFFANEKAQVRWIKELVDFTEEHKLDGINVDVELLPADLVPAYGEFVGRLRDALRVRLPDAQVSVSTGAGQRGAAMAAAAALAGADRIFLMGYDYHFAGSQPGASAPMDRLDGEERDLAWSLDRYASMGVPVERTILGLPLYGMMWPVSGPGIGAPSLGRGDTWVPRRNLRVFEADDFDPEYNAQESVEFYAVPGEEEGTWDAVYFDSPRSLIPKLALANDRGLAGAGFWAIGYTRGLPEYTELIDSFAAGELPEVAQPAE